MILLTSSERTPLGSDGSAIFSERVWAVLGDALCLAKIQVQILRAVFDDSSECGMAASLGVSILTVRSHLGRIRRKLGARTRVELALRVATEFIRLYGDPEVGASSDGSASGTDRRARRRHSRPALPGVPVGRRRPPSSHP
ncbi:MAG: helix-turn-helix transcriptional regulator [Verrucomicrobiota bacterium]